jgi:LPXTG-motif cell wall-anchored protein
LKYIYRGGVLAVPAPHGEGEKEEGMDSSTIQVILLIAACVLLAVYLLRRRKRKSLDQ